MTRLEKHLCNLGLIPAAMLIVFTPLFAMRCAPHHSGSACADQCHSAGLEVQRFDPGHACICSERKRP